MQRVCVHENTHGIARSASSSPVPDASGRDAGRDPISRSVSSSSGVNARRNRGRSGSSHTTDRYRAPAARETASIVSRAPSGASRDPVGHRRQERRCDGRLEIPPCEAGETVLERDRLPLLGHLEAAVDRVRRLREDRRVRRPSAAPCAPAAAVEDGQLDPALAREPGEPLLGAEDLPLRGDDAAVLARVRVADHHLEARARDCDREARRRAPRRPRRSSIVSSSGTTATSRPGLRRRATPRRGRRPPCASSTRSACRSPSIPADAGAPRPPRGRRAPRRGARRELPCVQTEVERRSGEAEQVEATPQGGEAPSAIRVPPCARRLASTRSSSAWSSSADRVGVVAEPLPDRRQPPPVRLGRVALRQRGRRRRRPRRRRRACSTCPTRRRARGRRGGEARGRAADAALHRLAHRLGACVRVSVEIAADPRAEPQRACRAAARRQTARRSAAASQRLSSRNQSACRISSTTRGRSERTSSVCHRIVISSASATSRSSRSAGVRRTSSSSSRSAREAAVLLEDRARQRLRRMGGQHELDGDPARRRRDVVAGDAVALEQRERLGERLARRPALALVLAAASDAVVLLGDVGEVEVDGERAQDDGLRLDVERRDRLGERPLTRRSRRADRAGRAGGSAPRAGRRPRPPAR